MADRLTRVVPADLELRGAERRTIHGVVMPFDAPTEIIEGRGRYVEVFRRGSFARTIAERGDRVKLMVLHQQTRLPIGRASLLREDPAGLLGEFPVSRTAAGDEVLELVRDGALDGLSVGFRPINDRWSRDRTQVERLEVALAEVSVVAEPAFDGARIVGVRSVPQLPVEAARQRLAFAEMRFPR